MPPPGASRPLPVSTLLSSLASKGPFADGAIAEADRMCCESLVTATSVTKPLVPTLHYQVLIVVDIPSFQRKAINQLRP